MNVGKNGTGKNGTVKQAKEKLVKMALWLKIQACGNCENDSLGCAKVTQSLFCVTLVQFT